MMFTALDDGDRAGYLTLEEILKPKDDEDDKYENFVEILIQKTSDRSD